MDDSIQQLSILCSSTIIEDRFRALTILQDMDFSQIKPIFSTVARLLQDSDEIIRSRIIEILSELPKHEGLWLGPAILPKLGDPDPSVRYKSIEALERFRYKPAIPKIINLLKTDPNELVRIYAAEHLGYFEDPSVLPDLLQALEDLHRLVVSYSLSSIGLLGNSQTLDTLRPYITRYQADEDLDLLCEYYLACYRLGDRSALATLNEVILQKRPHSDICMTLDNQIRFLKEFRRPNTMDEDEHVITPSIAYLEQKLREQIEEHIKNNPQPAITPH